MNEMTAKEWFEDVLAAGERKKDSEMKRFREVVFNVLIQVVDPINAEKVIHIEGKPAVPTGQVANSLKKLFTRFEKDRERYNRSYQYLKSMEKVFEKSGWGFVKHDGRRHIVLLDPERFSPSPTTE